MSEINDKLIETISHAVGILYDPKGLKKAQREFTATIFDQTASREDLSVDEKMAIIQEYKYLLSKKYNREDVFDRANKHLKNDAQPENIDSSWIISFWDKAGTITNEGLKELWGRVLAQEANTPNTISKRLLHNLSLMSLSDAQNFINIARFCFDDIAKEIAHPLIFIKEHPGVYAGSNITTQILKELELYSLIETNYDTGFAYEKKKVLKYQKHIVEVSGERIKAGNVRLTEDGQCLYKIVEKTEKEEIFGFAIEALQYNGSTVKVIDA